MSINSCELYAFKVQGLVDDIIRKLNVPNIRELMQSESIGRDNLIRDIFNGFSISLLGFTKPAECSKNIKVFLENTLQAKPSWKNIDLNSFQSILNDVDALKIIELVQKKIDDQTIFTMGGGRRSFKKHTTSTKRKSIKRSRSNRRRRRHRRTARK